MFWRTRRLLFLIGYLCWSISSANGQWIPQNPGTSSAIGSTFFLDQNVGWIAYRDTISRTADGGQSWSPQAVQGQTSLVAVFFVDGDIGYTSGAKSDGSAAIYKTTNGGRIWTDVSPGIGTFVSGIHFVDHQKGWAFGQDGYPGHGRILRTTDGGISWRDQLHDPVGYLLSGFFLDSLTGWAVGDFVILKTTDAGATWLEQDTGYTHSPTAVTLRSVFFIDAVRGWVVGGLSSVAVIASTTDGGDTWSHQIYQPPSPPMNVDRLVDVTFANDTSGWIVGRSNEGFQGLILGTLDGGKTFARQDTGSLSELLSVSSVDERHAWASGAAGAFVLTTNGGVADVEDVPTGIPARNSLFQNYPNPFNSSTTIEFSLGAPGSVTLSLYDVLGRKTATLVSRGMFEAGRHRIHFDSGGLPSGVYVYRLEVDAHRLVNQSVTTDARTLVIVR